jgi:probable rRNA maturation factor
MPTKHRKSAPNINFEITNTTYGKLPRLPFVDMKNAILGKKYDLSLVVVGNVGSQKLNRLYRSKNKPTNVLSFSLSKNSGEIFLNLTAARREATFYDLRFTNFVGYLFIHACLHLKGREHGSRMEQAESKFLRKFGF